MHTETFYTKKNIKETKLALISDIHYYENFNLNIFKTLIKQIKKNKPDYITITGDILDTSSTIDLKALEEFLKELASITTTLVVLGNHDEKAGSMHNWTHEKNDKLIKVFNSIDNLYHLNDSIYQKDNITFYGFHFSYDYYEVTNEDYKSFCKEAKNLNTELTNDTYNITLFHSPINIYRYIKENQNHSLNKSDLILSGHMHNGCLPYLISHPLNKIFKTSRSIISPTRKLFPKYSQGRIYERDGYIYDGVSKLSHSTKWFHKFDWIYRKRVQFITIKKH